MEILIHYTMQLSQLVTSLETSKRLKELWIEQESLFYWVQMCNDEWWKEPVFDKYSLQYGKEPRNSFTNVQNPISAFTSSELWEMMKEENLSSGYIAEDMWWWAECLNAYWKVKEEDAEAEARWKLYIYLKENNLVWPV